MDRLSPIWRPAIVVWSRITRPRGRRARRLVALTLGTLNSFLSSNGTHLAAGVAYYALVSLFPLAMLAAFATRPFVSQDRLEDELVMAVGDRIELTAAQADQLRDLVDTVVGGLGQLSAIALLGLVWSASGMISATRSGLSAAWDAVGTRNGRNPILGKLLDIAGVVVILVFAIAVATASVVIETAIPAEIPTSVIVAGSAVARIVIVALALFLIYRYVPNVASDWAALLAGAVTAAFLIEVATLALRIYYSRFASFDDVYGPLAAVVAALFYAFVMAAIILVGAHTAARWRAARAGGFDADPMSLTPAARSAITG